MSSTAREDGPTEPLALGGVSAVGMAEPGRDDPLLAALVVAEAPPTEAQRARLFRSVAVAGRLEVHAAAAAALLQAPLRRARQVLRLVDEPAAWLQLLPALETLHLRPAPALAQADVGLVRLGPGAAFPFHAHAGGEDTLVLEGLLIDERGEAHGPGARLCASPGSAHAVSAGPEGVTYLAVVWGLSVPGWDIPELPAELLR